MLDSTSPEPRGRSRAAGGNKTKAAKMLGVGPSTLYRKLERYGIEA